MIKYVYKVMKPFVIVKDSAGRKLIRRDTNDTKGGSKFRKRSKYVDYEFPSKGIKKAKVTKRLRKRKFIKLAQKVQSNKTNAKEK